MGNVAATCPRNLLHSVYTRCENVHFAYVVAVTGRTKSTWLDFMQEVASTFRTVCIDLVSYIRCPQFDVHLLRLFFQYDVSLPITKLYDLVPHMRDRLGDEATNVVGYGHLGDGKFYFMDKRLSSFAPRGTQCTKGCRRSPLATRNGQRVVVARTSRHAMDKRLLLLAPCDTQWKERCRRSSLATRNGQKVVVSRPSRHAMDKRLSSLATRDTQWQEVVVACPSRRAMDERL